MIVGSPFAPSGGEQRGFVSVYFARPSFDELTSISVFDADWRYDGHMVGIIHKGAWKRPMVMHSRILEHEGQFLIRILTYRMCIFYQPYHAIPHAHCR